MEIIPINGRTTSLYAPEQVGSKAANLARMAALGLPVPPAFVLPIEFCAAIIAGEAETSRRLSEALMDGIKFLEASTGKGFGDRRQPLLVSVRSGAARSMPGMLDTVLDVGCTPAAVDGLVRATGNPRFAWDCRRRFLESYAGVVLSADGALTADRLALVMREEGVPHQDGLDGEALERVAESYKEALEDDDYALPETAMEQLRHAARAVYRSWTSDRAKAYRQIQRLDGLAGTAVTVQAMVFGNRGATSGAGVAFSRDCSTGAASPVIDILFAAQGEDIVSGRRNPETEAALEREMPGAAGELRAALVLLEKEFGDVQDVEFTLEEGRLWLLQTRTAKRTPGAALRFAVDFVHEQRITPVEAMKRLEGIKLEDVVTRHLADAMTPTGRGVGASAGVGIGRAAFETARAEALAASGEPVILIRPDISTSDVAGFAAAEGIVTAVGGRTAHAALVARQMGKPCVVGCTGLVIEPEAHRALLNTVAIEEGSWLSIDGTAGTIYVGRQDIVTERPAAELAEVEGWRTNAAMGSATTAREG